jgi:NAD(P)-dependent dehydrogenase (short-subunit alcohol dehydrogenase family)
MYPCFISSILRIYFLLNIALIFIEASGNLNLKGITACVTGSSRGIGRGIALSLGEKGATVYITGRSGRENDILPADKNLGGCLEDVAAKINALGIGILDRHEYTDINELSSALRIGGVGIPVVVDHRDDNQVRALFDKIDSEQGRLDLLVNNAFQIPTRPDNIYDKDLLFRDFWEQPGKSTVNYAPDVYHIQFVLCRLVLGRVD